MRTSTPVAVLFAMVLSGCCSPSTGEKAKHPKISELKVDLGYDGVSGVTTLVAACDRASPRPVLVDVRAWRDMAAAVARELHLSGREGLLDVLQLCRYFTSDVLGDVRVTDDSISLVLRRVLAPGDSDEEDPVDFAWPCRFLLEEIEVFAMSTDRLVLLEGELLLRLHGVPALGLRGKVRQSDVLDRLGRALKGVKVSQEPRRVLFTLRS